MPLSAASASPGEPPPAAPPGSAALSQEQGRSLGSCFGLFGFRFILQILRAGGEQVIDLPLGETVNKGDGHIPIEQQALAGIGVGDVGKLVLGNAELLCQDRPVTLGLGQQDHKVGVVQNGLDLPAG